MLAPIPLALLAFFPPNQVPSILNIRYFSIFDLFVPVLAQYGLPIGPLFEIRLHRPVLMGTILSQK